ncbi:MAG: class I SAM-dependent methyltransferase [Acidobacteria bacterium]|nr:class I SAM-dependent methyltransferase [Acidobacteriota bacterium]MBV9476358.1 class I SAM-dependent methyltransferase [Acidobacteriota bacterium]
MPKEYDRAYFERWYHRPDTRVNSHLEVRRKVALAVAMAEYVMRRPLRSVLDVGCGEGAWLPHLRALRSRIEYTGLDPSDYAVERFGRTRNIHKAAFHELPSLDLGVHDLVICSDVLHYVAERDIRPGIAAIAKACDGLAFLEVLTKEDDIVGDLDGLMRRPAAFYRNTFRKAGFTQIGPYCWLPRELRSTVAELEIVS